MNLLRMPSIARSPLHAAAVVAVLAGILLLTACQRSVVQVKLDLPLAFYPSAIAWDEPLEQYLVGSYQSGDVVAVLKGGQPIARLRAGGDGSGPGGRSDPVLRLAMDEERQLWVGLPSALEVIPRQGQTAGTTLARIELPGAFVGDVALLGGDAYVLDTLRGRLLRVAGGTQRVTLVADLPEARQPALAGQSAAERMAHGGALAVLPDRRTLLVADGNGALWRFDAPSARLRLVARDATLLAAVTQLVSVGSDARGYRLLSLSGMANRMTPLVVARDFSRIQAEPYDQVRMDTPLRAVHDGRRLQVLLGWLRHHPDLQGNGRPAMPARVVSYVPPDTSLRTAAAGLVVP
jgi:hypothetical protein